MFGGPGGVLGGRGSGGSRGALGALGRVLGPLGSWDRRGPSWGRRGLSQGCVGGRLGRPLEPPKALQDRSRQYDSGNGFSLGVPRAAFEEEAPPTQTVTQSWSRSGVVFFFEGSSRRHPHQSRSRCPLL